MSVTASASHDFNRHVGGYVKGEAKASATAFAEGVAPWIRRRHGAALGPGGRGRHGGCVRHGGRARGPAARLGHRGRGGGRGGPGRGKLGLENGFLKHSAEVNAAAGVGTHLKTDVALDLRHHIKPGIASGLRPSLAAAAGRGLPRGRGGAREVPGREASKAFGG